MPAEPPDEVLVAVQGLQSRVRSLQDENAKLKEVVRQTQRERDNHIAATTEIQKFQTDSLLEEVAALRQENETIHKSQGSLQLEISRQREENARLKARLAALTDDVVKSAHARTDLEGQLEHLRARLQAQDFGLQRAQDAASRAEGETLLRERALQEATARAEGETRMHERALHEALAALNREKENSKAAQAELQRTLASDKQSDVERSQAFALVEVVQRYFHTQLSKSTPVVVGSIALTRARQHCCCVCLMCLVAISDSDGGIGRRAKSGRWLT